MQSSTALFYVIARILAVGLFFTSGIDKLFHYSENLALMTDNQVPTFFLPLVILLEVGGSLAIALGFLTRFTAFFMAIFSILAAILFYQGWSYQHLIVWLKNASCAAGLILLVIQGAGRFSLDYWFFSSRQKKTRI
ncbi:DoxX family protein [Tatumella sp. OPLPL6]|uniref:DoxX family protein n=1 Tax=Tatumella sp. OPLPL6 TaxID=1928657 RepID=UPI000C1992F5|nr:DoxX family protein [Tatumella sp. OPLPL6]PIJ45568.1 DoxX family protein [Tatumella sp. OPLPL6]